MYNLQKKIYNNIPSSLSNPIMNCAKNNQKQFHSKSTIFSEFVKPSILLFAATVPEDYETIVIKKLQYSFFKTVAFTFASNISD